MQQYLPFIALISPLFFILTAIASWFQSGTNPNIIKKLSTVSTVTSIASAIICGILLLSNGPLESMLIGIGGLGFSIRLDSVSIIMFGMIALLGFIIVKYSFNYLNGDNKHGSFLGRLAAAMASVQLLVLSGNLALLLCAWILTSISLHRLLVFYKERPGAIIAARKKFLIARMSDLFLTVAVILLYQQFGTGSLQFIFDSIQEMNVGSMPFSIELACIFLALAAIFKSAQFPTHGWLIEVMETPTPVSALLHAGLLNAGPFLIIRFAYLFNEVGYAPTILIATGGITALFGCLVFLTQTSVKTTLAYSSIAHMGFSLMMCGIGAYPAAMLHLVAHSFYKAHSFLSSGSVIEVLRAAKGTAVYHRKGNVFQIGLGVITAVIIYSSVAFVSGFHAAGEYQLFFLSVIIMLGLIQLLTTAFDSKSNFKVMIKASVMALLVTISVIFLESGVSYLMIDSIPKMKIMRISELYIMSLILLCFAIVIFIQATAPSWTNKHRYQALAIHLKNGLYINVLFDRLVGAWKVSQPLPESKKERESELEAEFIPYLA